MERLDHLIARREPSYLITANLNYAMLTEQHPDLDAVNREAALVVADGMPLLWAARWAGTPLPERLTGSDLIFRISELAAQRGYRLFLLGGPPGLADTAAANLSAKYPGLKIVGTESPPFRDQSEQENEAMLERIRAQRPDIMLVAFSQPRGERWIHANYQALGVPLSIQVGASLDFAAGRVKRAPRWMQKTGLEWLFRLMLEPRRLGGRYYRNTLFLLRKMVSG
jgi:N-acetylglucosaminyldiphosphoundecaprenol N-acetyl-beta-D-mannosaminyltransferase